MKYTDFLGIFSTYQIIKNQIQQAASTLRKLLLITISLTVVGCASGKYTGDTSLLYSNQSDTAYITVMRQSAMTASGLRIRVELDGKEVAMVGSGDYIKLPVRPGEHFVARTDTDIFSEYNRQMQKIEADAYSGDSDHLFWFYSIIRSSQRDELIVSL